MKAILIISLIFLCFSCTEKGSTVSTAILKDRARRPSALNNGKFFELNGNKMQYGGPDSLQHFIINNSSLKNENFHYGIGREAFPALLDPQFITVNEADEFWADSSRFLIGHIGDDVKAYSVKDLTHHEIINDTLGGRPIMAAYCVLADLGAIYERNYGDKTLTFALSGYTYFDDTVWNGLDGFVFWDRETESLWWPLIGKAISGPLKNVKLLEMDHANWEDTDWKNIKEKYPNAQILKSGQNFEPPTSWEKIYDVEDIIKDFSEHP